jgi:hypothetical protein
MEGGGEEMHGTKYRRGRQKLAFDNPQRAQGEEGETYEHCVASSSPLTIVIAAAPVQSIL